MIKGYPKGSNLTILNTMYRRPTKDINGKYDKGSLQILYKDVDSNQKKVYYIEDPTYTFYMAKDDIYIPTNEFCIHKSKVNPVTVPYRDLLKVIADLTDKKDMYYENIKNHNRYANEILHTDPKLFGSDLDINDFYRIMFNELYVNDIIPVTKGYFDIELDGKDRDFDTEEDKSVFPINAISYISPKNIIHIYLLKTKSNLEKIEAFQNMCGKEGSIHSELEEFIIDTVGGFKKYEKFSLVGLKFEFNFFEEEYEIDLIRKFFWQVNIDKADFMLAWNMAFDIPTIIGRIMRLGWDPREVMCHKDFKDKIVSYYIDTKHLFDYEARGDYADISSYSIFIDQMIQFASRRKGQSAFSKFNLDYIGSLVAKVKKLSYKHITNKLSDLPYIDYKTFVFYNIIDTIVQKCIEESVNDIDYIFGKVVSNHTRYSKIHRQTVYEANKLFEVNLNNDHISGNNINKFKPKTKDSYPGAYVSDPVLLSEYSKIKLNGVPVSIYDTNIDYDYTRLYPSTMQEFGIAPNTILGAIQIPDKIYENENKANDSKFSRSGVFIDELCSGCYIEFCKRWFNMAGYEDIYDDVIEYFSKKDISIIKNDKFKNESTLVRPIVILKENELVQAIVFEKDKLNEDYISSIKLDLEKNASRRV